MPSRSSALARSAENAIEAEFPDLRGELAEIIADAMDATIEEYDLEDLIGDIDALAEKAIQYAEDRAAELVTKINETTREGLNDLIARAVEDNLSPAELADQITGDFGFSDQRADLIARTEMTNAWNDGVVGILKDAGERYVYVTDGDGCEACAAIVDDPIWTIEEAEANPSEHPNCEREFRPLTEEEAAEMAAEDAYDEQEGFSAEWDPEKHPRDDKGQWTDGDGGLAIRQEEAGAPVDLTTVEIRVVERWASVSNDGLRANEKKILQRAIAKQSPSTKERVFFRGVSSEDTRRVGERWNSGELFTSVSTNREIAKRYNDRVVSIRVPVGVRFLELEEHGWFGQGEVILGQGTAFRATGGARWEVAPPKRGKFAAHDVSDQPRDDDGRWTDEGTGVSQGKTKEPRDWSIATEGSLAHVTSPAFSGRMVMLEPQTLLHGSGDPNIDLSSIRAGGLYLTDAIKEAEGYASQLHLGGTPGVPTVYEVTIPRLLAKNISAEVDQTIIEGGDLEALIAREAKDGAKFGYFAITFNHPSFNSDKDIPVAVLLPHLTTIRDYESKVTVEKRRRGKFAAYEKAVAFLDGDADTATAALLEHDTPADPLYEATTADGDSLGMYLTAREAADAAEAAFPATTESGELFYSDDQPRDDQGRWTDGAGGSVAVDRIERPRLNLSPEERLAHRREQKRDATRRFRDRQRAAKGIAPEKPAANVTPESRPTDGEKQEAQAASPPTTSTSPETIAEIEKWEDMNRLRDSERCIGLDPEGGLVILKAGEASRIAFTSDEIRTMTGRDLVFSHNHPGGWGFSSDDICFAADINAREMRAAGQMPDGTKVNFVMTRPDKGWPQSDTIFSFYNEWKFGDGWNLQLSLRQSDNKNAAVVNHEWFHAAWTAVAAKLGLKYERRIG